MAFDLSAAANILKVRYLGPVREQLNTATILTKRIAKGTAATFQVSGKTFTIPLHTGRNKTAGSGRADGGTLPSAATQSYEVATVPMRYLYSRIEVTGPTIRAARDNAGAFVTAVESEIKGSTRDTQRSVNRQMLGDGTDALAYMTEADNDWAAAVALDDSQGNAFVHLESGGTTTVDVIDATDNYTKVGNSLVFTLGAKGATTYTGTATSNPSGTADGDFLVLEDTLGYQLMGLDGIINNNDPTPNVSAVKSALQGLAAASYPFWNAQVFTNSGTKRDLSLALMQEPLSAIAMNSDFTEADVEFMLCNYPIRDKYVSLLVADKRFVNTMTLDGGFKGVEFNGIPLVVDPQCKRNTIFYVVPESLRIFELSDYDWMEKDGSQLSRVSNKDSYEAILFAYKQLGTIARNANAKLGDITD